MQISVESGEGLEKRLLVDLPADRVGGEIDKKLVELSKHVRLDGFRPGKVPMRVIKQRFSDQVRQEVYGDLIQATFYEAATEQKLSPAGDPNFEIRESAEEGGFGYTATFEVMPEVALADLSSQEVTKPVAEVADSDVDEMIEKLRKQRTEWVDVERAAQDGDTLHINFKGTVDGEAFDGGSADNVPLVLGSGSMIEGFESGLLGASAGDERTLETDFPDDYRAEHLAGKSASFETTVLQVAEAKLPEIDDEFVKAFGVESGGEAALRKDVRKNMVNELDQKLTGLVKDNAMTALREANPLEIPAAMISQEAERMKQQAMADMEQRGQASSVDFPASIFEEQSKSRVHLGLLVANIIDSEGMSATDDELRSTITKYADSYEDPEEVVDHYMNNEQQRASIQNLVLENKVVDWIMAQVKVTEEQKNFSDLMDTAEQ